MSSSNIWLAGVGLLAAILIVVVTASSRRVVALGALLLFIPFQVVESRYASSSVLMAYAMAGALLLMGNLRLRMLPAIGLVLLAYLLSYTQAERYQTMHAIEIFQVASCFIVFLLAYNFSRLVKSEMSVLDLLLAINVLVVIYCGLQLTAGAGQAFNPFGIHELAFNVNRDPSDPRLVGPFDNPGTTAGYFALMTMICLVTLMHADGGRRRLSQFLTMANMAGIVATGNRASFLVLLATFPILLLAFRAELGPKRFFQYMTGGIAAVVIASAVIAAYSGLGNVFNRLQSVTETEGGLPTTRALTWPLAFEKIKLHPWFGEGPHFVNETDAAILGVMRSRFEELGDVTTVFDPYPHSLYLFLLRTIGVVGLIAYMFFFGQVFYELRQTLKHQRLSGVAKSIVKVGTIVVGAFLVTQITLEFNRPATLDYAQFVLALMGLLVGVADRWKSSPVGAPSSTRPDTPQPVGP